MILGEVRVRDYLEKVRGEVRGRQLSDAKDRYYEARYDWKVNEASGLLEVSRRGTSPAVKIPQTLRLDESLVAFFGLYSGDGAKGSEDPRHPGLIRPPVSFSQREPNLIRFAVKQFRRVFPQARFTYSLGEDSAYFFAGEGLEALLAHYRGKLPDVPKLARLRPHLNGADLRYLAERRRYQEDAEADLAFYYYHKEIMQQILASKKAEYLIRAGIELGNSDRVTASLRRPYKKGARVAGGSSRSDETHVGGVTGMGELFLKIMHEIEASILEDSQVSPQGLVEWIGTPSRVGEVIDVQEFFRANKYGEVCGERPVFARRGRSLVGRWPRSKSIDLKTQLLLDPNWCYTSGLYLAEGTTPKQKLFSMYSGRVSGLGIGFTSSENTSIELMLRALSQLFPEDVCLDQWKVKVGSQYFPELVVVGLKNGVPMLRGGRSGDGKLRTMEISLAIKAWALEVAPSLEKYSDRYSHVEPTGAGVPRIDFWASSALCKWYFPLLMFATFGQTTEDPAHEFTPTD